MPACTFSPAEWNPRGRASWPRTARSPGGPYPQTKELSGGFTVIDVPTREAALEWAAKIAVACRCAQEVREFGPDPELDEMLRQADSRR